MLFMKVFFINNFNAENFFMYEGGGEGAIMIFCVLK